jgi:hypothetical protein
MLSLIWKGLSKYTDISNFNMLIIFMDVKQGGRVTHGSVVVKALCWKQEGRGFKTRWSEWMFSIYLILPTALGPEVYSASNRNEYQKKKNNVSRE